MLPADPSFERSRVHMVEDGEDRVENSREQLEDGEEGVGKSSAGSNSKHVI